MSPWSASKERSQRFVFLVMGAFFGFLVFFALILMDESNNGGTMALPQRYNNNYYNSNNYNMPGAPTRDQRPDRTIQNLANRVMSDVKTVMSQTNTPLTDYTVVSYRSQVVSGTNYFLKIRVNNSSNGYIHIKVFQGFDGTTKLTAMQVNKSFYDALQL